MVVSYVKWVILTTLEEMVEVFENEEERPIFLEGEEDNNLLFGVDSSGGSGGGRGGDKQMDSKVEPLNWEE